MDLRLMGTHEIRERLGVSRQRIFQITCKPTFPKPALVLAQGKIWHTDHVEKWIREHRDPDLDDHL